MGNPPLSLGRPIALVGMMGSGKSSIGRRLAARLNLPFVDSDAAIEEEAGRTISEIFTDQGEDRFRALEESVLARLATTNPKVIATGGGAFIHQATRAILLDRCLTIWLQADPVLLERRVSTGKPRPLLANKEVGAEIRRLVELRDPIYAEADMKIACEDV